MSLQRDVQWKSIGKNSMEETVGAIGAPSFYFMNGAKSWQQVQQLLKSQIQWEQWLKSIIYQKFLT